MLLFALGWSMLISLAYLISVIVFFHIFKEPEIIHWFAIIVWWEFLCDKCQMYMSSAFL